MDIINYFFVALLISFLGSVPIGLISLTIVEKTIYSGKKSGYLIAAGASVMEFVYTFVALFALSFFEENKFIYQNIKVIAIFIFLILAIYYFLKSPSRINISNTNNNRMDFVKGILIGTMNVLILPFWIVIGLWLKSVSYTFESTVHIFSFSIGSTIGAAMVFVLYVLFSVFIAKQLEKFTQYLDKLIGSVFLVLAIVQLAQIVY